MEVLMLRRYIAREKTLWGYDRPPFPNTPIDSRTCDVPATVEDSLALAALCQAMVAKLAWLHKRNRTMPVLPRHYIEENLWRAVRYGLDAKVADFAARRTLEMRESIHELLDFVDDVANDLGTRHEMNFLRTLLDTPY